MGASSLADKGQAENMLSGALKSLFAVSEAYPDLKANQNFWNCNANFPIRKIKFRRRVVFITATRATTIAIDTFPSNIIANSFKFQKWNFSTFPDNGAEAQPVPVNSNVRKILCRAFSFPGLVLAQTKPTLTRQ